MLEKDGYSKEYLEVIRVREEIMDQRKNREIIFVSFILLKALVDLYPQKALKLIKIIIGR